MSKSGGTKYLRVITSLFLSPCFFLSDNGEETLTKPQFLPSDTLQDIVRKTREEQENNQQPGQQNSFDLISKI